MSRLHEWRSATPAVAWLALVLGLGSNAGQPFSYFLFTFYSTLAVIFLWFFARVIPFVVRHGPVLNVRTPKRKLLLIEPIAVLLAVGLLVANVPFTVRFVLSKNQLENFATRVVASGPPKETHRAGLFHVLEAEVVGEGAVRMITTECGLNDCGIVYSRVVPPRIAEDSYTKIWTNWWQWERSW